MYHVAGDMFHVSRVTCHMSHVTCHMSLTPTATAANPSSANPPTMQIGLFVKTKKTVGQFYPPFEQKYEVLTPLKF